MLARYYLKRRDVSELLSTTPDVSELLLKFDFFIIADVIASEALWPNVPVTDGL